ncbi:retroviral-like aspartic protease family protein [Mucilaginibacter sp. OK098]|uniref:retroviral-like aspartic protease family protein n=1 Tax=Mucilaginibacter sp. OK098 TaxID=1855297 RepID=UPI00091813DA|nr:retroviral-like aspartic protease family protein [Mucilaginibacter sp. OK098]SHN18887.1 Predicted aspartyl protease [Mucilaginibacter sp. OK098]
MISKYQLYLIAIVFVMAGCTRTSNNAGSVRKLKSLLDKNEYFKLDAKFKLLTDSIDDDNRLYFKSYLDNAFNRNNECIKDIDSLLKQPALKLPDSVKSALKRLQGDSYFKTYQYAKAAQCDSNILKQYKHALHKDDIDDISNDLLIRNALKNIPAQQTLIKNNTTIPWKKDKIGLIEIPFTAHEQNFDAIFDTRANISSITQTYAKKLGLHILDVSYNEGSGATGLQFKTGMGIADSLYIGDVLVKNVVFQVMPDSILYIAPVKFQLNVIIGFPVIEQLREVHIFSNGKMTIPLTPAESDLHNFALDGLDPVIALKSGNDTLSFHFDSGASSSVLYAAYFEKYKARVIKAGTQKTVGFGGAGGAQKKKVYVLPKFNLTLGSKSVVVDNVSVLTKPITPGEKFYGNIGQDFTNKFSEVIYNFKDMYINGK